MPTPRTNNGNKVKAAALAAYSSWTRAKEQRRLFGSALASGRAGLRPGRLERRPASTVARGSPENKIGGEQARETSSRRRTRVPRRCRSRRRVRNRTPSWSGRRRYTTASPLPLSALIIACGLITPGTLLKGAGLTEGMASNTAERAQEVHSNHTVCVKCGKMFAASQAGRPIKRADRRIPPHLNLASVNAGKMREAVTSK